MQMNIIIIILLKTLKLYSCLCVTSNVQIVKINVSLKDKSLNWLEMISDLQLSCCPLLTRYSQVASQINTAFFQSDTGEKASASKHADPPQT